MDQFLRARSGANGGLFTVADAHDAGVLTHQIHGHVRRGEWVRVRRGVYMESELWAQLDERRGRPLARARAATLTMHRGWVFSHSTAAIAHGLPVLEPQATDVHVTRAGYTSAWSRFGVSHHYARFAPDQVVEIDGYRCLDLPRTVADIARDDGERAGLIAADAALRRGCSRADLDAAAAPMTFWPGVVTARSVIGQADPRAESPNESLARLLIYRLGLGDVDVQFPLRIDGGLAWCDLRVGNHIFEVDGRIKYQSRERGGVADRVVEDVVWDEKRRERLIRARDLGLSRILWEDHSGSDAQVAAAMKRLSHEFQVTRRVFGSELHSVLAQEAADLRARFGWRDGDHGQQSA